MTRGRRVVLWLIFIFLFSVLSTPAIFAQTRTISVTATVEPSPLWINAIKDYSLIQLDNQSVNLNKPVKITVTTKGLLDQILAQQKMNITVYLNNVIYQKSTVTTGQDGIAGFAFVPVKYGNYLVRAENITYNIPIQLSPLKFDVQESSVTSIINGFTSIFSNLHISL